MNRIKTAVELVVAFTVGIVPGFFINLNSVFSDRDGSWEELVYVFLLIIIIYALLGIFFGLSGKQKPLAWAAVISLPAAIFLVLYSFREPNIAGQSLLNLCLTFASVWAGSSLSMMLKAKRSR